MLFGDRQRHVCGLCVGRGSTAERPAKISAWGLDISSENAAQ